MYHAILFCVLFHAALATVAPTIDLNDGNKIPVVALGTGRGTARKNETLNDVRQAVLWAIQAGYRHIDTAAIYHDEEQVGQGIADAIAQGIVTRNQLFVTTKLWSTDHETKQVLPALRQSLTNLGLTYVDLYLVHFPSAISASGSPLNIDYLDTWRGMEEAKRAGLARSIGVSNFNGAQIDRLLANSQIKPAVNQIEVSPTLTQEELVSHCQQRGIAVMAYSPFGFLVLRKNSGSHSSVDQTELESIADKYHKSTSQVILKYLVDRGLIVTPKSTNQERIAQNIDLFDFQLSPAEMTTISKLNTNRRVITFDTWQEYPHYPFEK